MTSHFNLDPQFIYLNHAAVAPWPQVTCDAVTEFAQQNARFGASFYPQWLKKEQQLRQQIQQLINAPSHADIALLKNTSEALSVVAHGIAWQPGDNVVLAQQEFPSNQVAWHSLQTQGVELRYADLAQGDNPEHALLAQCNERTRLLTVSSVQYGNGLVMQLDVLGQFCQQQGILFCVDAIQSLGVLPLDVQAIQADFVMADGHKWLCGPEGLALFYCRAALRPELKLHQYGWHMLEHAGDYDRQDFVPSKTARRFECGSPNMLAIHALSASLGLLLDIGIPTIQQQVQQRSQWLMQQLAQLPNIELLTPTADGRYAGIVTFRSSHHNHQQLFNYYQQQNLICAQRGGGIRLSPHFYTDMDVLERAMAVIAQSLR